MTNMKLNFHTPEIELLFILGSTKDSKGRRVLVKCSDGVENTIYPGEMADETLKLIGIGTHELKRIQKFFIDNECQ